MSPRNAMTITMEQARKMATFDPKALTVIIYGSKEAVSELDEAFARVEKVLDTSDTSKLPSCYGNLNREEVFLDGLKDSKVIFQDGLQHNNEVFHYNTHKWAPTNKSPFHLHTILFIPFLKLAAAPDQLAQWLPLAESGKILGTYCQTELAHGTFVAGIETTATFLEETDEFDIHTPSLAATKFWPGSLGFTCSHTIVMARLIIKGKDLGVHPFMVQLRSLVDHKPMPGIELGDLGLKMSYNEVDNGFASFKHVRIPRTHLLMRHASVARDGSYNAVPLRSKLLYGGMLNSRIFIIRYTTFSLARAATIAIRYSTVRTQGRGQGQETLQEIPIMSYKSQHYRLLTIVARAYAILFAWQSCDANYKNMGELQRRGVHTLVPQMHMLASGLKAWATQTAADAAEEARKCCGGQGYLMISGLPEIANDLLATCTFEGENYVLWQQVALYLMKGMASTTFPDSLPPDMAYVASHDPFSTARACTAHGKVFGVHKTILDIFHHRAARLIHEAAELLSKGQTRFGSRSKAWDLYMMELIRAARAHIETQVLVEFITRVETLHQGPVRNVLSRLVSLFGLATITSPSSVDAISFTEDGFLSLSQLRDIRDQVNILLEELLPDAIALTDAWNFTDASLCSALGMKDGNVYETIMNWTKQLPINVNAERDGGVFLKGYQSYIKPVLEARSVVEKAKL